MGDKSAIQWTDATWNPVTGCSKVSPGCAHCYAETVTAKYAGRKGFIAEHRPWTPGNAEHNVTLWPERLEQPLHWTKPRMVFVNSMSDLFHEQVPDEYICKVFDVMRACIPGNGPGNDHTFQVLTKRPERMRDICLRLRFNGEGSGRIWLADNVGDLDGYALMGGLPGCRPMPNVWLGVSIENRRFVSRADVLRKTPAAVRFVSAEPLLGPLVLDAHAGDERCWSNRDPFLPELDLAGIDWLIVGGESGSGHRPMRERWVRDLRDECRIYGTAFFFKQWGGRTPKSGGRELDGRTWDEMPAVTA
jgi:protein gp37